ncbi:MAG: lipopolysaccharide transport periplasmic protein LptA [Nevskiaceae bacterium]
MSSGASALAALLTALASLATAAGAQAQKAMPTAASVRLSGPIKITAERAELERREYALYRGRVKLVSQDMVLTGDRLELRQPDKGQFEVRLTGKPARLDHAGDARGPPVSASAAQIVYDTRTSIVELSGGVQLARGADQLSGGQVSYNLAARRISANASGEGQVQLTITPPAQEAPLPEPPAPARPLRKKK